MIAVLFLHAFSIFIFLQKEDRIRAFSDYVAGIPTLMEKVWKPKPFGVSCQSANHSLSADDLMIYFFLLFFDLKELQIVQLALMPNQVFWAADNSETKKVW